jgi:RNA polymerase sigma-70 factor, ECF subfamily
VLNLPLLRAERTLAPAHAGAVQSNDCSDEELLVYIQNGDEASLLTLFHRYNRLAFSVGLRVLHDQGEAEDFVQEVFLRLCSTSHSFDSKKGSARKWIIQMIYRRAFDRRAYLYRRHFYSGADLEEATNAVPEENKPEIAMIERLTAQQLKAAFSQLNDKQRRTLESFFFEGLTLREIAERSNEDVRNVRHHYYRGLERLRQLARQMMRNEKVD